MTANGLLTRIEASLDADAEETTEGLLSLLERRRSIRRLQPGPASAAPLERIAEAIRLTPAAYNLPPWHVVLIPEERFAFWQLVEEAFLERLDGDRLQRYLDRLAGFRGGAAVALI